MIRKITQSLANRYANSFNFSAHNDEGQSFLTMVENYFDKAGIHTGIRSDYLNFYKKPDNVVKCTYPIVRGTFQNLYKKTALFKPFPLIDVNIKLTNSQPKEEQDMLKMLALNKLKLLLVSWVLSVQSLIFLTEELKEAFQSTLKTIPLNNSKESLDNMLLNLLKKILWELQLMSRVQIWVLEKNKCHGWNQPIKLITVILISMLML